MKDLLITSATECAGRHPSDLPLPPTALACNRIPTTTAPSVQASSPGVDPALYMPKKYSYFRGNGSFSFLFWWGYMRHFTYKKSTPYTLPAGQPAKSLDTQIWRRSSDIHFNPPGLNTESNICAGLPIIREVTERLVEMKQVAAFLVPNQSGSTCTVHKAFPCNDHWQPNQRRALKRTQICRLNRWRTGLRILLFCCIPLTLSGCEAVMSGTVAKSAESNPTGPTLSISATSVSFDNVEVNTTATQLVTLTSTGTAPVTTSAATLTGVGFTQSGATFPVILNPGQTATLKVQFHPATTGEVTGQLTIVSNSSTGATAVIGLSGNVTPVLNALSCSFTSMTGLVMDACTVTLNAAAPNGGQSVSLTSSNAAVTLPTTVTVPANGTSAEFTATASPVGTAEAVTLTASVGSVSKSFVLQLNSAAPTLSINATSVGFGNVVVNSAATQSVTLTSTGTAPVTISAATLTGVGFTVSGSTFPVTLSPGQTATLEVQFDPGTTGVAAGQLTVTSNSSTGGRAVISLSGTGTASGSFAYAGSPLVNTLVPPNTSTPISSKFFGMTIGNLATNTNGTTSGSTPFPSFQVPTLRFWDVAYWKTMEPSQGQYNWTKMDGTIATATENGVNDFIFTFGHVPQWASTNPSDPCTGGEGLGSCAPPNMDAFDDFATHVVQRYCGKVRYYETWNEPNSSQFWDGTNAQLLTVAQHLNQITKDPANCGCTNGTCSPGGGVNPNKVLLPSISRVTPADLDWLDSFLATAGSQYPYADVASFHGYGNDTTPENIVAQVQLLGQTLNKHGLANLQLWNTEASWGEETSTVDQDQASWLMRYHTVQAAAGVSRFVWYAYDNCNWGTLWSVSPCGNTQVPPNGLTVPGTAYDVIEAWLIGANLTRCDRYQNGLWACELTRAGNYDAWMLWSSTGTPISVSTPATFGLTVYRDWQNNLNTLSTQITVNQMPVLLESNDL